MNGLDTNLCVLWLDVLYFVFYQVTFRFKPYKKVILKMFTFEQWLLIVWAYGVAGIIAFGIWIRGTKP